MLLRSIGTFVVLLGGLAVAAQDKAPVKFGKINPEDFNVKIPVYDSGSHAIILADIGESKVLPNNSGGFGYEFERKMRVYIVDINGVDAGKFEIPVYSSKNDSREESVRFIKGYSYNLEGGRVTETKLESKDIFKEKIAKTRTDHKFSMPQLKAGTIFELTYRIESDFLFDFRPWEFQSQYPCLWSEYYAEVPEYYDYVYLKQGYLPMHIDKSTMASRSYNIRNNTSAGQSSTFSISGNAVQKRWVIKDVPALKEESFTTTIDNHRAKIEFQLASIRYPEQAPILVMESWTKLTSELMSSENFGSQIDKNNGWLNEVIGPVVARAKTPLDKAKLLHAYVRDNFECTRGGMYTSGNLKNVVKTRSGNVADLNLLLLAMLRHEKIESYPIILSTRSHGFTNEIYPLLDRYNYVICAALIGENDYIMDASVRDLGFNKLHLRCYNGHARVLTAETLPIHLVSDSVVERKVTMVTMDGDGKTFDARVQDNLGYFESVIRREEIRSAGKSGYLEKLQKGYATGCQVNNLVIDSLQLLEEPIKFTYDLKFANENEDIAYITPVLAEAYKENPFKSAVRRYPVEMPYCIDETYLFTLQIPEGWKVDDLPKSTRVSLNENEGMFEYLISADAVTVQMRCRVKLDKATFQPDEYDSLRDFFAYVVKKQQEQVVLKKK